MSILHQVHQGRTTKPPRLLIYGGEGIGKSTFGSQAPKAIFVQVEDGADQIDCAKFPMASKFTDVVNSLKALAEEDHNYQTVVVDSLSALERLVWDEVCRETNVVNIEKVDGGYGKGYVRAIDYWREVIGLLDRLRNDVGMAVILIAHAKVEQVEDPDSPSYDRHAPRLNKHASAMVVEWCDAVLFATRKFRNQTEDAGFGRKRTTVHAVGHDGGERILRTVGGPSCLAKNRFSLPLELPLSWEALVAAMSTSNSKIGDHNNG
ncbi:MAG: ATP-binding protein [Gemmataceae bacterium]